MTRDQMYLFLPSIVCKAFCCTKLLEENKIKRPAFLAGR